MSPSGKLTFDIEKSTIYADFLADFTDTDCAVYYCHEAIARRNNSVAGAD